MTTRREALRAAGIALGGAFALPGLLGPARAETANAAALAQPGPLGDSWLGSKDAKVTIIEYASMTCTHCAAFHKETWPKLKERYVDTGKVRFALREFPLDLIATAAFMLARADGSARYYPITDLLFERQADWAFVKPPAVPVDAMEAMLAQIGVTKEKFEATLKDKDLYEGVIASRKRAAEELKVNSTPTFFINGEKFVGESTFEAMEAVIKPLLGE